MTVFAHKASVLKKALMIALLRRDGVSFREIGNRVDMSESRCRQIHTDIHDLSLELVKAYGYSVQKSGSANVDIR